MSIPWGELRNSRLRETRRIETSIKNIVEMGRTIENSSLEAQGWRSLGAYQVGRIVIKPCGATFGGSRGCSIVL